MKHIIGWAIKHALVVNEINLNLDGLPSTSIFLALMHTGKKDGEIFSNGLLPYLEQTLLYRTFNFGWSFPACTSWIYHTTSKFEMNPIQHSQFSCKPIYCSCKQSINHTFSITYTKFMTWTLLYSLVFFMNNMNLRVSEKYSFVVMLCTLILTDILHPSIHWLVELSISCLKWLITWPII